MGFVETLYLDEAGLERRRCLPRQRMELLRWTQFPRCPRLALADHLHELDAGKGSCS